MTTALDRWPRPFANPHRIASNRHPDHLSKRFKEAVMDITITKADSLKTKPEADRLGFGTLFTDPMFNMDYDPDRGWHSPRI